MTADGLIDGAGFPPATREEWLALARKALGGAAPEEALVARTDDGLAIHALEARRGDPLVWSGERTAGRWAIVSRVDDPDPARANAQALGDLRQGADGLTLVFAGAPNAFGFGLPPGHETLARALQDVPLHKVKLRVDTHPGARAGADRLAALLMARRADPEKLGLCFGIDPTSVFAGTGRLRMSIEALEASLPQSLGHFFALGVPSVLMEADGRVFHNAGATEAQELGAALASAVSYLRLCERARQALVYAAPHIGFSLSASHDQLATTAKFRALRVLWARVAEVAGIPALPAKIHAETSWRMLAALDPETNIVRSTVAAFAAGAGGADSLSVLPHTTPHGLPEAGARRIALGTQLVLAHEGHVGSTADPASGTGAVEALTDRLCEAAWEEFRRIESEGGPLRSLLAGRLQARIREARDATSRAVAAGERTIVGTTRYRPSREAPVAVLDAPRQPLPADGTVFCERLDPMPLHASEQEKAA